MLTVLYQLKRGATKNSIRKILEKLAKETKSKGIDAYKYCGKISLKEDTLATQKRLRDEWE